MLSTSFTAALQIFQPPNGANAHFPGDKTAEHDAVSSTDHKNALIFTVQGLITHRVNFGLLL